MFELLQLGVGGEALWCFHFVFNFQLFASELCKDFSVPSPIALPWLSLSLPSPVLFSLPSLLPPKPPLIMIKGLLLHIHPSPHSQSPCHGPSGSCTMKTGSSSLVLSAQVCHVTVFPMETLIYSPLCESGLSSHLNLASRM